MKKVLFSSILFLFVFAVCLVRVNAANTQYPALLQIPANTDAQAPSVVPADESTVYATVTTDFDFSKIQFSGTSGTINGKSNLKKIIIGIPKSNAIVNNKSSEAGLGLFDSWFTAYCLDETKKYPLLGLFNSGGYVNTDINPPAALGYAQAVDKTKTNWGLNDQYEPDATQKALIYAAIMNDPKFSAMLADLASEFNGDLSGVQIVEPDGYFLDGDLDAYLHYLMKDSGATEANIGIGYVGFSDLSGGSSKKVFYAANADQNDSNSYYNEIHANHPSAVIKQISNTPSDSVTIPNTLADLALNKYTALDDTNINNYEHALWIVENSYPTLSVADTLAAVKVDTNNDNVLETIDVDALKTKIIELDSNVTNANVDDYLEMYVYGTVQYAIWKATNQSGIGTQLGNEITNCPELNKLYKYLIANRSIYNGYSHYEYSNTISFNKPVEGKELAKTTDTEFIYGPFSATYDALVESSQKINVTIKNANPNGIRVTNSNFTTVTSLDKGQQFYVAVDKNANVGNVSLGFTIGDVIVYPQDNNRGRVYYPIGSFGQNAMTGGKTSRTTINGDLSVITNAKTGVQNIALLLMVTLVAFTLGYFVLSYKQKPIGLNQ